MAIYSNIDIEKSMKNGTIEMIPKPSNIGQISIDLGIDTIYEIDLSNFLEIYNLNENDSYYKQKQKIDSSYVDLESFKLKKNKHCILERGKPYIISHKEKIFVNGPEFRITRRSGYARCGLDSIAFFYENGKIWEIVVPQVKNIVYPEDKISQVSFFDQGSNTANRDELICALDSQEIQIFDEGMNTLGKEIVDSDHILLNIGRKIKYFKSGVIDRKNFIRENFVSMGIGHGVYIPGNFFVLSNTREVVDTGSSFIGSLENYGNSDLGPIQVHLNSPFTFGAKNNIVLELPEREYNQIPENISLKLGFIKIKTPGKIYSGKFKFHSDIKLPW
jgi:deoxycytidine triphosphate deaminase